MKKTILLFVILLNLKSQAQSYEVQRLILDIQKLAQMKNILTDLYKGYEILNTGYTTIKSISEGNFNLHKTFLDGLLAVSPAVRNYQRVVDIIDYQSRIVSEYKSAFNRFQQDKHFNPDEISYMMSVYNNLLSGSLTNLTNLFNIITANVLRMSDNERLHAIDGIYVDTKDKYLFISQFDNGATMLAVQRATNLNDVQTIKNLYGLQ